jgi:hypothetical protein
MNAGTRPASGADHAGERAVRRFVTVLAVTVGGLCFAFSAGNVYQLAVDLGLWAWIRPLVAPAVDLSLVALVVGIRFLARRGLSGAELRRPRLFLLAVGLAAWALNTAGALAQRDWGKAAFDSLAPGLLVGWAEVLPWFLRQFHAVTHPAEDGPPVPAPVPAPSVGEAGARPIPAGDGARVPSRPRRASRPSQPSRTGTGPAVAAELAERARTVAAAFEAEHGRPISRDALGRALHVGNRVAGELLRAVRDAPPQASIPAVPPPAAGTGPPPASGPAAGNGHRPAPSSPSPSHHPAARVPLRRQPAASRIAYVMVVTVAILVLVGKDNTHALSAQAVDLLGQAGQVLLALLRKYL